MKRFCFKVAEWRFDIGFENEQPVSLPNAYKPFFLGNDLPTEDILFTVSFNQDFHIQDKGQKIGTFNEDDTPQVVYRKENGSYQFELFDTNNKLAAEIQSNAEFSYVEVCLHGDAQQKTFGLNNAMMISFAFASATQGTLLMHSSVTMLNRWGYLFLGKSGTGKSTHSRLWLDNFEGTELLNDDNPVVRFKEGKTIVYGSPWSGKTPCYKNLQARAGAFVMLEQQPFNQIERQTILLALSSILTSCTVMVWDKKIYNSICKTISNILNVTPVYGLKCLPNLEAAQLSRSVIEK